jgi:DNA-binding CsgD family transcriptional regulator
MMNPWSRLQWVNKRIGNLHKEIIARERERTKLREIMAAELRGWPDYKVTRRESEVLTMLAGNPLLTNKEIANNLFITERTVKFHMSSLLKKFDATDRGQLMQISREQQGAIQ